MNFSAYLGLDVHKDTIAIAIADAGRAGDVRFFGEVGNTPEAVAAVLKKLGNRSGDCTSSTKLDHVVTDCIGRSMPPATSARSSRRLIPRGAPAITLRLIGATRSYWRACRAPESLRQFGFLTRRTKPCAISSGLARLPPRMSARLDSAFGASCCATVADMLEQFGRSSIAFGLAIKASIILRSRSRSRPISTQWINPSSVKRPSNGRSWHSCRIGRWDRSSRRCRRFAALRLSSPPAWLLKSVTCDGSIVHGNSWRISGWCRANIRAAKHAERPESRRQEASSHAGSSWKQPGPTECRPRSVRRCASDTRLFRPKSSTLHGRRKSDSAADIVECSRDERKHRSSSLPSRANSSASFGQLLNKSNCGQRSPEELTSTEAAVRASVPVRGILQQFLERQLPTSASQTEAAPRRKLGMRYPTRG